MPSTTKARCASYWDRRWRRSSPTWGRKPCCCARTPKQLRLAASGIRARGRVLARRALAEHRLTERVVGAAVRRLLASGRLDQIVGEVGETRLFVGREGRVAGAPGALAEARLPVDPRLRSAAAQGAEIEVELDRLLRQLHQRRVAHRRIGMLVDVRRLQQVLQAGLQL